MGINFQADVIIPLASSIIGGLMALAGVWITIRRERRNTEEQTKKAAKPWIFSLDSVEIYDAKKANNIVIADCFNYDKSFGSLVIIIKNTDNGVCIIEKFKTENNEYIPVVGKVMDKSSITYVHIFLTENETLKDMYLYVNDVYGNQYKYKVFQGEGLKECCYIEETK